MALLSPLYGGGFLVAFAQLAAFYYPLGVLLHIIVPALLPVRGIQKEPRGAGEPLRDALASIGEGFGWQSHWLMHCVWVGLQLATLARPSTPPCALR